MSRSHRILFSSLAATKLLRIIGLLLTMLVLYVPSSLADPITFVYQGTASGSIGGAPFSNAAFTITAFGDTANRQAPQQNVFFIPHDSASISITGLGTFTFTTPLVTFVNHNFSVAGLAHAIGGTVLVSPVDPVFATWDMLSSIGPVAGVGVAQNWANNPVFTNGGQLIFNDGQAPGIFTATVGDPVPEPATMILLATGLAGALGSRRVRRRFTKS